MHHSVICDITDSMMCDRVIQYRHGFDLNRTAAVNPSSSSYGSWLWRLWSKRIKIDMAWRILDIVTSLYAVWTSYYDWKRFYLTKRWDSGHGTYVDSEEVIASVAGTVERVNKLVTVRAIRSRYNPEVGDLVVGRITEANSKVVLLFKTSKCAS